jgi:anti-anti-sigma factor
MTITVLPPSARLALTVNASWSAPVARVDFEGTRSVVVLRGDVDFFTMPVVSDVLSRLVASVAGDMVIDLRNVDFVDAAAITAFATAQELLVSQGRRLTFRSPSPLAARVLGVFGLSALVETPR